MEAARERLAGEPPTEDVAQPLEWVVGGGLLLGGMAWAYNTWRRRGNQNVPQQQPPPQLQQPPPQLQQPPPQLQQPPPLVQLPQRHTVDEDVVNTLQALSVLFLAYAKGEEGRVQRGPASEVQAMRLDGHVLVSTNSRAESDPIVGFFNEGTRASRSNLGGTLELLKLQSNRAVSTISETTLHHAEQHVDALIDEAKKRSRHAVTNDQVAMIPHITRGIGTTPGADQVYLATDGNH